MATSIVDLCNQALSAVPARHIVSFNDNTRSAKECRTHFTQALEEVAGSGAWNFATKRVRLTEISAYQKGWKKAFQAPDDMAFPLRVMPSECGGHLRRWETLPFDYEGKRFWAHDEEVWLEYVSRSPEYSDMPAHFRKAVIDTLASRLIVPITGNDQRAQAKLQQAEVWRDRSNAQNLNENVSQNTYGDNYIPMTLRVMGDF